MEKNIWSSTITPKQRTYGTINNDVYMHCRYSFYNGILQGCYSFYMTDRTDLDLDMATSLLPLGSFRGGAFLPQAYRIC